MITKLELKRQFFHFLFGVGLAGLVFFGFRHWILILTFAFLFLSMLTLKFRFPVFSWVLDHLERHHEKKGMRARGVVYYLLGCTIVAEFFVPNVAIASILILAIGDSISSVVGPFGNLKHPFNDLKFIEGIFAGGVFAFFGVMWFVTIYQAMIASAIGMFVEGFHIEIKGYKVDDNLLIPIICAFVIVGVSYLGL